MLKVKILHLIKYIKYIPIILYVNIKLKCKTSITPPFYPLIITSRIRTHISPSATIHASPGDYIKLGYGSGGIGVFEYTGINLEIYDNATIEIDGISLLGYGSSLCVYKNAHFKIGDKTYIAGNSVIKCEKSINIGKNCAISWNVTIIDSDFHPWSVAGIAVDIASAITIEDHVWIGNNVTILKGVSIGTGSIIGAGSIVTSDVPKNCLVAGCPAKIIRKDVTW